MVSSSESPRRAPTKQSAWRTCCGRAWKIPSASRGLRVVLHLLGLVALVTFASAGDAQVLPIIVDRTGESDVAWWTNVDAHPAGALDAALFSLAEGDSGWLSPGATRPNGEVSSLLRRVDVTPTNARALGGLYGANSVLVGAVLREEASDVPWLGLERGALVLDAVWLDVRSGAQRGQLQLRAVAFGRDARAAEEAAVSLLVEQVAATVRGLTPRGTVDGLARDAVLQVVVRSVGTALPFVAFRGALRESSSHIVEVSELWATEGQVALTVALDESASPAAVAESILRMQGRVFGEARVERVSASPEGATRLNVLVVPAPPPDSNMPTLP